MAHIAFVAAALCVSLFFLWRRQLDPLAVAFGSSLLYFLPGILGIMQSPLGGSGAWYTEPVAAATYAVMGIVIVALALSAAAVDLVPRRGTYAASFQSNVPGVLLVFVAVATAASIQHTGVYYLCLEKSIVLQKIDPWYSYASIGAPLCVATAYALRQQVIVLIGCVFLLADIYAGFRTSVAITLLAIVMLSGEYLSRGWRTAVRFSLAALLVGTVVFSARHLLPPVKYAAASYCDTRLAQDRAAGTSSLQVDKSPTSGPTTMQYLGSYLDKYLSEPSPSFSKPGLHLPAFMARSEPFVIQAMLNEVIRKDFRTDSGYLAGQLLAGLPLGERLFGIDSNSVRTFNSRAQPVLFPEVNFGMANSPWAQAYAAGGLSMVAVFSLVYAAALGGLTLLFRRAEGALKACIAVIAIWIGFYFHRNDILVEVVYLKHVIYITSTALVVAWLASVVGQRARRIFAAQS